MLAGGHVLDGDDAAALDVLDETVEAAASARAVHAWIVALAQRALLRMARGDHARAEDDVREARALADVDRHGDHIEDAILHAAGARLALLRANTRRAHQELERADRARPLLSHALPWFSVGVLLELAHARLALGEVPAARELLADAGEIARRRPSLGAVRARADALAADLASLATAREGGWPAALTTAELRLLPLLTTHLTFREIGERLFISRNTVKTQAISIYRKLGASNRSEAITASAERGLLDAAGSRAVRDFIRTG